MSFNEIERIAEATERTSIRTLKELHDQGEILQQMNENFGYMDQIMHTSKTMLDTMSSVVRNVTNTFFPFDGRTKKINTKIMKNKEDKNQEDTEHEEVYGENESFPLDKYVVDKCVVIKHVDRLIHHLNTIKKINQKIKEELDSQNELFDTMTTTMENHHRFVETTSEKVKKI